MPITVVPGVSGVVNNPGAPQTANPLEGFAQQLYQAKQMQKESSMQELDAAMKLAQFDPDTAEKIGKPALQALFKHATGTAGGGTESLFKEIHKKSVEQATLSKQKAEADIAASQAQTSESNAGAGLRKAQSADLEFETQKKQHIAEAQAAFADETKPEATRAQALSALHLLGAVSDEQFANAEVRMHLTPEQRSHMFDNLARKIAGDKTEEELNTAAAGMVSDLAKNNYGGDMAKATIAAQAIVRGTTPPAADLTDRNIDRAAKIGAYGIAAGWPTGLIRQAQALNTTDLDKIGKASGWTEAQRKVVDNLVPLETRRVTADERSAAAMDAQRMASAFKDYQEGLQAGNAIKLKQAEMLNKTISAFHELSSTKPGSAEQQAIQKELFAQIGSQMGLEPKEVPRFWGIFGDLLTTSTLARPGDASAIESEGGPAPAPQGSGMPTTGVSSFVQPEVLGKLPAQMMTTGLTTVGAPIKAAFEGAPGVLSSTEDYLKRLIDSANGKKTPATIYSNGGK